MAKQPNNTDLGPVSCQICHREIPNAEALNIEGQEYVYFFCGDGCYVRWREEEGGLQGGGRCCAGNP